MASPNKNRTTLSTETSKNLRKAISPTKIPRRGPALQAKSRSSLPKHELQESPQPQPPTSNPESSTGISPAKKKSFDFFKKAISQA